MDARPTLCEFMNQKKYATHNVGSRVWNWTAFNNGQETKGRETYCLPTHTQTQRIAKDTRFPITTHKQMATFSTKLISCLSPISKGKNSGKQGKKSRAAYIPFLFFDFRPSIHTHTIIIIIITQIKREKKKSIRFLFPFSLALWVANNNSPFCHK